jgi:hypothetical protein
MMYGFILLMYDFMYAKCGVKKMLDSIICHSVDKCCPVRITKVNNGWFEFSLKYVKQTRKKPSYLKKSDDFKFWKFW